MKIILILFSIAAVSSADILQGLTDLVSPVIQGIGTVISPIDGAINDRSADNDTGNLGSACKVRYGPGTIKPEIETLPRTVSEAIDKEWILTPRPPGPPEYEAFVMYCYVDRVICALYYNETISGVQVAYPIARIISSALDLVKQGFVKWDVQVNASQEVSYWATQQFWISPESAKTNKSAAVTPINDSDILLKEGSVWVVGFNGQLFNISTRASIIRDSIYKRQACQAGKGIHYLYNTTKDSPDPCRADNILHWFPIIHKGQMVATGLFFIGKVAVELGERDWFERPPPAGLRLLIPNASDCFYKLADQGVVSTHIYYVDKINPLLCPLGLV